MKELLKALLSRPVLVATGLVAASALIWYLGPLLALGGVRPLAADWSRWLAITLFSALAASTLAARGVRDARTNRRLLDGLMPAAPPAAAPGAHEVATIARRFEEAVALLKASRLGGRRSVLDALAGRPYLYQLPWYIIIGAPGAGKTTALANSGLEFPLASKFGKRGIRGVGGTRNCDWWFTSDAVLIDTAGRFTTQDSDPEADHAAWSSFLDLLRKYRPRRPVNGVLLTVSVSDLLGASTEDRRDHARRLRERVDELAARVGPGIPIYVLITKLDLLAGFMEFFADFDKDERAQVWGVTFPYGGNEGAPSDPFARLSSELVALEKRLDERLLERLHGESDRERRAAIYAFPQQWRVLRETLAEFLQASFGAAQPTARPLVRGVYFTSATQEGTPMDRALGGLARALGLANRIVAPARPSGKTFFVTRLLREVVFAEAGLAGANLRWQRGSRALQCSAGAVTATAVALALAFAWRGYRDNQQYLAAVQARAADLERSVVSARAAPATDLGALLPVLDALPAIGAPVAARAGVTALRRWFDLGLDQSAKFEAAGQDAYRRLLREALLPRIAVRLQQRLRAGASERIDTIYEALKAYLMLFGGQHFDRAGLRTSLRADWELALPGAEGDAGARLRRHFDRLVASGEVGAPVLADRQLIERARALVARVPLAQRVYTRLRSADPEALGGVSDFTLDSAAGPAARQVFTRASGGPLTEGVPALYTRAAFQRLARQSDEIVRQLAAESSWVLGTVADASDADVTARARLYAQIEQQYLADYARAWDEFLRDLRIVPTATLAQSEQVARVLARTDSPLLLLVRAAARELTLEPLTVGDAAAGSNAETPTERFAALRRFAAGESAPVQETLALLGKLAAQLAAIDDAARRKLAAPASDIVSELSAQAARSPEPVRTLLAQLATVSTGQIFAAQRDRIAQQLASEVGAPCDRLLQGRYPLARSGKEEVSLQDFAQAFAANGWLDGFFQSHLAQYVDASARAWTLPAAGGRAEAATLAPFQQARTIRNAFFHDGGRAFGVRLDFRLLELDPTANGFELQVNGQTLRFSRETRTAQVLQWPGAVTDPAAQRVRVGFTTAATGSGALHSFEGSWALFRLFERVRVEPGASPDRVVIAFDVEGRRARFEVKSDTPVNPIRLSALEQFQCPHRL
jgi:type VI secretion system protein ImpL